MKFLKDLQSFHQIFQRFKRLLQIYRDFIGFLGHYQIEEGFARFSGFSNDFRISFWMSELGVRDFRS